MDWGHGFIPRIDRRNWSAVDRALGPPGRLPVDGTLLDLPWTIVDLDYARYRPSVIGELHAHGAKIVLDGGGWRYRESATFSVAAFTKRPFAPTQPLDLSDRSGIVEYVQAELREQCALGADA